jgi:lambda repressor-like predicted transcriptional regulator
MVPPIILEKIMKHEYPLRAAVHLILNKRGMSKYALSKKMGIAPQGFDSTLKRDIRMSTFLKIADALELTPGELADAVDNMRA